MKIQNVKGGYDFSPKEQKIRNYINNILRETFEQYGYQSIETPILCYYDILTDKYNKDNDILKEIYKLSDQGERKLGLRYDLTVPFAKFIALNKNNLKLPFKRFEINKVFRDGPVKIGRDREFTQCDVDVVGLSDQMIEAELLCLYIDAFTKLKIEIIIKYNSRNLMKGLIIESGVSEELVSDTITIIDKIDKLTINELNQNFIEIGLEQKQIDLLLKYFNSNLNELNIKFSETDNKDIINGLQELNKLERYINKLNLDKYCIFTSSLARGQNYYTGNVFEVYEKNGFLSSAIGAGGRYDKMITNFINDENDYPAVGISFGLSPIYEILKNRDEFKSISPVDIYIIPLGTSIECLKLAKQLRALGIKIDVEMNNRRLKKSLDYANKEKIPYVIILGEDEIKNNIIEIKDMFNNNSFTIKIDDLEKIKEYMI